MTRTIDAINLALQHGVDINQLTTDTQESPLASCIRRRVPLPLIMHLITNGATITTQVMAFALEIASMPLFSLALVALCPSESLALALYDSILLNHDEHLLPENLFITQQWTRIQAVSRLGLGSLSLMMLVDGVDPHHTNAINMHTLSCVELVNASVHTPLVSQHNMMLFAHYINARIPPLLTPCSQLRRFAKHSATRLTARACAPWSPSTHILFGPRVHARVVTMLSLISRDEQLLEFLPLEMWFTIMSFFRRSDFTHDYEDTE